MSAFCQDAVGILSVVNFQQDLLSLAVDTVHKGLVRIRDGMAVQGITRQAAHDIAMHAGGTQTDHQQGRGFADNLVVEFKGGGILGMVMQVFLKVKKRHEPTLIALKDNLVILKDEKGRVFHRFLLNYHLTSFLPAPQK